MGNRRHLCRVRRLTNQILDTKLGRLLLAEGMDPGRVRRLGTERLRRFCLHRGLRVSRAKAAQVFEAARVALELPAAQRMVHARILRADVALLGRLHAEIAEAEGGLA